MNIDDLVLYKRKINVELNDEKLFHPNLFINYHVMIIKENGPKFCAI